MVKLLPSKQVTRVRFPSPALWGALFSAPRFTFTGQYAFDWSIRPQSRWAEWTIYHLPGRTDPLNSRLTITLRDCP